MLKLNLNHIKLPSNYLFASINQKVNEFKKVHPELQDKIIKLGIGDVTRPLPPACIKAMKLACDEMGDEATFRGYPDYEGYDFLLKAISKDYASRGVSIDTSEIFVSDGAKSDTANIQELFAQDIKVAVTDPVYPVYVDSNAMAGRNGEFKDDRWTNLVYLDCTSENNFIPQLPTQPVDIIYMCSPNNPTGQAMNKDQLKIFVDYATNNHCIILFDAAYEAYITEDNIPHSIYEIPGAKKVAIEFKSFSKTAGFTGIRCAYCVVPKDINILCESQNINLNRLWFRRQATKFNGVSYITQRGAEATFSDEGKKQIKETISYYLDNASIIRQALKEAGFTVFGGVNSPYLWTQLPSGTSSWKFFDYMLEKLNIVGTPGSGFGKCGESFFRFTAFSSKKNTIEASRRISEHKFNI